MIYMIGLYCAALTWNSCQVLSALSLKNEIKVPKRRWWCGSLCGGATVTVGQLLEECKLLDQQDSIHHHSPEHALHFWALLGRHTDHTNTY